jgi:hypothetical protein
MFQRIYYLIESKHKNLTDCKLIHLNNPVEKHMVITDQKHVDEIIEKEIDGFQSFIMYFKYLNKSAYKYFIFSNEALKDPSYNIKEFITNKVYKWAKRSYEK